MRAAVFLGLALLGLAAADCGGCCAGGGQANDCSFAFRGSPGVCCGQKGSKPYCCPDTATCVASGDGWGCQNGPSHSPRRHSGIMEFLALIIILPLAACLCLIALVWGACRRSGYGSGQGSGVGGLFPASNV